MTEADLNFFMGGGLTIGAATVGLFFTRFYQETRDRLFLAFATAFFLLAANWLTLAIVRTDDERRPLLFILRLLAFVVILLGIWDKNRSAGPREPTQR